MGATGLPVYLYSLWGLHPDLQASFAEPLINPLSAHAFLVWALDDADPRRKDLPGGLRAHLAARIAERDGTGPDAPGNGPVRPGLNVMGYLNAELGVGQAARLLLGAADAAGVPTSTLAWDPDHGLVDRLPGVGSGEEWSFDTNVLCINADMTGTVRAGLPVSMFQRRATAGVWFWEAERFPDHLLHAFDLVDEVWAPSRFIADALDRTGRGPVVPIRMPVPVPAWSTSLTRTDLGLPEGFLVLFTFDFASVFDRKNPLGLIDAYCRAFGPDDGAHLVLKTVGGARHWEQMELLRASVDRPDILVMDGFVRPHQVKAMLELSDCYASLHRSEGFGLGLAEAMALGKPVVATAWSGNMDFMDDENSYLVPADLVPIPDDVHVYGGLGRWAEPDLDAAADALRSIHDDRSGAAALGRRAREHMARTRDPRAAGEQLAACAERLRRSRWPQRLSA